MRIAVVKTARDPQAGVWYVETSDVEGLRVEGETFEIFSQNGADPVADLLEKGADIPVVIIAHVSVGARALA